MISFRKWIQNITRKLKEHKVENADVEKHCCRSPKYIRSDDTHVVTTPGTERRSTHRRRRNGKSS